MTHQCGFCASNVDCIPRHSYSLTGFTNQAGGTTERFTVRGVYPTGICANFGGCF